MKNKTLFILSVTVFVYFSILLLNSYVFKWEFSLLGVFQELLTIPMLIFQVVLLIIAFKRSVKNKFAIKNLSFWSFVFMLISCLATFGSFITQ